MNLSHDPSHEPAHDPARAVAEAARAAAEDQGESFNPWSVVNLVFSHLSDHGLHPVLGESGDPGAPARDLLVALGIEPAPEGNREVMRGVRAHLAEIRAVMFEDG